MRRYLLSLATLAILGGLILGSQHLLLLSFLPQYKATPLGPAEANAIFHAEQQRKAYAAATKTISRFGCTQEYAVILGQAAVDSHVSPRIVGAVAFTESRFNARAVSAEGAIGLLQVNPRVWHFSRAKLRDPRFNAHVGTLILAGYIRQYGLREGLHHFNGMGDPTSAYADRILEVAYR